MMLLLALLCVSSIATASLERLSGMFGVEPASLEQFFHAVRAPAVDDALEAADLPEFPAHDTTVARSEWLRSLALLGPNSLSQTLGKQLFEARMALMGSLEWDLEKDRTLLLYDWVDDLVRQRWLNKGQPTAWFHSEHGFVDLRHHREFPYQNADVLLVLGGSSVSSLITQATLPRGRFSHAMMLHVSDGGLVTLETLIETGAISRPSDVFDQLNLQALLVLRWRGIDGASQVDTAVAAIDAAKDFVRRQLPYDMRMDMADSERMFCSEFVANAFAAAAGVPTAQLVPFHSRVRSPQVSSYLNNFGVSNSEMISPGDLLRSGLFDVVAEFRNADDLSHYWRMLLNTEAVLLRLENGYQFAPAVIPSLKAFVGVGVDSVSAPLRWTRLSNRRMVPASLNRRALATMITQENILFARPQKALPLASDLFTSSLWDTFTLIEEVLDTDFQISRILRQPPIP